MAEAQGLTFDETVVFRSNTNKIPIFDDAAQVTTAFTRHRSVLRYCTAFAEDDLLVKWMRVASRAKVAELEAAVALSPQVDAASAKA